MKERVVSLALAAAGAVLAIGVLTFAGPCMHDDGTLATCFGASRAVLAAGIVACVAGLAGAALARNIQAGFVTSAIGIIAGIVAVIAPGGILPLCMMQTMRCWTVMRPFALVLGVVIILIALVALLRAFLRRRTAKAAARHASR